MERSYLFFSSSLVARTYDVSNEEKRCESTDFNSSQVKAINSPEFLTLLDKPKMVPDGILRICLPAVVKSPYLDRWRSLPTSFVEVQPQSTLVWWHLIRRSTSGQTRCHLAS
ncbi:hypothetical protein TNCV_4461521 [Trichonephila clavipes]|nr:hypothetical protein TNCV_4461521 [Trichonephila clavipes]